MTTRRARLSCAGATVLSLLGLLGPACNDLPPAIERLRAEHVAIIGGNCFVGPSLRVIEGGDCEVVAEARDANGQVVVEHFSWSTGNLAIATVSPKPGFDTMIADVSGGSVGVTTLRVEIAGRPEVTPQEIGLTVFPSGK
ncbi:MAG: hypothetical protein ACREK3_08040 [Gemmatimonadota bacterium]